MAGTAAWALEKELSGHTAGVFGCAWSPDGSKIVSGSGDKTVRVWDIGGGCEVAGLEGHTGMVTSCA
jgi:WD40 repeat protein